MILVRDMIGIINYKLDAMVFNTPVFDTIALLSVLFLGLISLSLF